MKLKLIKNLKLYIKKRGITVMTAVRNDRWTARKDPDDGGWTLTACSPAGVPKANAKNFTVTSKKFNMVYMPDTDNPMPFTVKRRYPEERKFIFCPDTVTIGSVPVTRGDVLDITDECPCVTDERIFNTEYIVTDRRQI